MKIVVATFIIFLTSCTGYYSTAGGTYYGENASDNRLYFAAKASFRKGDYVGASRDLQILADRGNPKGCYALGYLYYYGIGVPKNVDTGRNLFRRAAAKGNRDAVKALRILLAEEHESAVLNKYS